MVKIKGSTASQAGPHSAAFLAPHDWSGVTPEHLEQAGYCPDSQAPRAVMLILQYSGPGGPCEDPVWRNKLWLEGYTCVNMACFAPVPHYHRGESIHPMDPKNPTIQKSHCPKFEARPPV